MPTSTDVMTQQQSHQMQQLLAANFDTVRKLMPRQFSPARMVRIAHTAITHNPFLAQCSQISIVNAVLESAMLGLEMTGPLGQAYLVPFKKNGVYHAQLMVGYRGMIELASRSDKVSMVTLHEVYAKDEFAFEYGTAMFLKHKPCMDPQPGELVAAYAMVRYTDGSFDFEVVDRRIAMAAKARSQSAQKSFSPWNQPDFEPAMWAKTAARRLAKRIPQVTELQRAIAAEELNDLGKVAPVTAEVVAAEIVEPSKTAEVMDKMRDVTPDAPPPESEA